MRKLIKLFTADALFAIGVKFTIASAKLSGHYDMAESLRANLDHPVSRWRKRN
jgi:hypothetical protein